MAATPPSPAQAKSWRELLDRLECWVLIYGDELPQELWDDIASELDALAPGIERDVAIVRRTGEAAVLAHPEIAQAEGAAVAPGPTSSPPPDASTSAEGATLHATERGDAARGQEPPEDTDIARLAVSPPQVSEEPEEAAPDATPAGPDPRSRTRRTVASTRANNANSVVEQVVPAPAADAGEAPDQAVEAPESAPAPDGSRPLRWIDIAEAVLLASGKEMTAREIFEWSQNHGPRRAVVGKTPAQSINRDLHSAIRKGHPRIRKGSRPGSFAAVP